MVVSAMNKGVTLKTTIAALLILIVSVACVLYTETPTSVQPTDGQDIVLGKAELNFTFDEQSALIEIESVTVFAPNDHDIQAVIVALETRAEKGVADLSFPVGQLTVTVTGPSGADPLRLLTAASAALVKQSGGKPVTPTKVAEGNRK